MCEDSLTCPNCHHLITPQQEISCYEVGRQINRKYHCRTCGAQVNVEAVVLEIVE